MTNSNEEQVAGVYAEDMSVADLKQLCKENNLDIKGKTSKKDILEVVHAWEKTISEKTEANLKEMGGTIVMRKHKGADQVLANIKEVSFHEGKKVISKTDVTHNGREYTDIVVEGGITHRVPKIA